MKDTNLETREELQLPDGGYICEVIDIVHDKELKRLIVYCDIADGDYVNLYETLDESIISFTISYDVDCIEEFANFISAMSISNPEFSFDLSRFGEDINCIDATWEHRPDLAIGLVIQKSPYSGFYCVTQITTVENIEEGNYQLSDMEQLEVTVEQFEDVLNSVRKFLNPKAGCFINIIQRELDKAIISFLTAAKLAISGKIPTDIS